MNKTIISEHDWHNSNKLALVSSIFRMYLTWCVPLWHCRVSWMEQFCQGEVLTAGTGCTGRRELHESALWIGMQLSKYANWPLFNQQVRVWFSTFSALKEACLAVLAVSLLVVDSWWQLLRASARGNVSSADKLGGIFMSGYVTLG